MRTVAVVVLLALAGVAWAADDEREKQVAEQKKQAEAGWKSLEAGEHSFAETRHLLIYAPKDQAKNLKATEEKLRKANVQVTTTGANRVRISPAVYNNMEDINRLLTALA